MTPTAWPFLWSVRNGRTVRNGPPEANKPEPKQRQKREKKAAPQGQEARW